ncbi:endonuclease-reverse transcriptase [Elysia marginata]|uniref:Endonuclease-reverse transcriptase n=1 Tax=Elysia marginata TaxID=1093978 RepID=A0AAV4HN96_9GAST|nr:endonuclease-reverse transcriptase [Elysia marginata]
MPHFQFSVNLPKGRKEYTEDLYKRDPNMTSNKLEENNYEKVPPLTNSEVRKAINEIASGKSPGADEIPIVLLKDVDDEMITTMTAVSDAIWDKGTWPKGWKQSIYVLLPKKGDPRICSNNPTIALISHASKI